jgi:hypothetical protein
MERRFEKREPLLIGRTVRKNSHQGTARFAVRRGRIFPLGFRLAVHAV